MLRYDEEQIISGLLNGHITLDELGLTLDEFTDYRTIFQTIRKIINQHLILDVELVYQTLLLTDDYFTRSDIERLVNTPSSTSTALAAASNLKQASLRKVLTSEIETVLTKNLSGGELLENLKSITQMREHQYRDVKVGFQTFGSLTPRLEKLYSELHEGVSFCVPTFFREIDDLIADGFTKGDLHIIAGMTGAGKSSLMLTYALNQAKMGYKVGIVSREMSDVENMMRLQSADAQIPRWFIRKGLHREDYEKLLIHLEEFQALPIWINTQTTTIEGLELETKLMRETTGLDILYVDYLQLMTSSEKFSSRANEVQKISRTLKEMAMTNEIPIVALSQFNRNAANVSVFEIMHQLKESSGLEQDASTIQFVQVEQTQERKRVKTATNTILKNRNGTPFVAVNLEFVGELFTFREITNEPAAERSWYDKD